MMMEHSVMAVMGSAAADSLNAGAVSLADLARLVAGMRGGDESALERLYAASVGKVYGLAAAILRNSADAEEVVCDTYAWAWSNAARFDATRANVLGWLLMLCRSRAISRLRQRRSEAGNVDIDSIAEQRADETQGPSDILSVMQERSSVRRALSELSVERRELVSMAFLQGLTHQEIAAQTGMPLGTVKSHLRRALLQLRGSLESI